MSAARCRSPGRPGVAAPCPAQASEASVPAAKRKPAPAPPPPAPALRHQQQGCQDHRENKSQGPDLPEPGAGQYRRHHPLRQRVADRLAAHLCRNKQQPCAAGQQRQREARPGDQRQPAAERRRRLRTHDKAEEGEDPGQRYRRGVVNRARRDQEAFHRFLPADCLALSNPGRSSATDLEGEVALSSYGCRRRGHATRRRRCRAAAASAAPAARSDLLHRPEPRRCRRNCRICRSPLPW